MPRISERTKLLKMLKESISEHLQLRNIYFMVGDSLMESYHENSFMQLSAEYESISATRYLTHGPYRKFESTKLEKILSETWMNDTEFLYHYRMSRAAFWELTGYIAEHPVFHCNNSRNPRKQALPEFQLFSFVEVSGHKWKWQQRYQSCKSFRNWTRDYSSFY